MANMRLTNNARNAMAQALQVLLDAGAGAGLIKVYSGTQPATGDTALSGNTLLGTLTLTDPAAGSASAGVLTFSTITEDSVADNTGTASFARLTDSTPTSVFDCDISATGGGGSIQLNTTSIVAGGPIRLSAFTITIPAS